MSKENESPNSNQETIELDPDDVTNPDAENEEEESNEEEQDSDDSDPNEEEETSDKEEESDDEGEYEIVLEGDDGLSDKELKTQKYHNRLNERKAETLKAQESEAKVSAELDAKNKELDLYKQLLQDKGIGVESGAPKGPPNPETYPDGAYDPKYIQDINAFHANQAAVQANNRILQARAEDEQRKKVEDKKKEIEGHYETHYQRATDLDKKLKVKDYDEMEKVALGILNEAKTDFIVEHFESSELIFYKFGKDPAKAKYFNDLLDQSPVRAMKELAIFESKIKRVKRKINKSPDPENRSQGGHIKSKKGDLGPPGATYTTGKNKGF